MRATANTDRPDPAHGLPAAGDALPGNADPRWRWPVAILGATGAVGQCFVRRLAAHPWFQIAELAASDRSIGRAYGEVVTPLEGGLPEEVACLPLLPCTPSAVQSPLVFSALDAVAAGDIEPAFARAGRLVLSNAQAFRMDPQVPILIPEINASHLRALDMQRRVRGWDGALITNANCAATAAALALAPLHETFGLEHVFVTTLQAVSGAGYPGLPALDILGNVVPFIAQEEPKIERELPKILGRWTGTGFEMDTFRVSAQTTRVPVEHGHLACLAVKLRTRATVGDALEALRGWRGAAAARGLPSAPDRALVVTTADARPQPRRDVQAGGGMAVTVGRVRADPILDLRLVALVHNLVRGAAGGSILNAELLAVEGVLPAQTAAATSSVHA